MDVSRMHYLNWRIYMAKVDVVLDLEQDLIYELMLMAHERDITLNQLIETILSEYIKNEN